MLNGMTRSTLRPSGQHAAVVTELLLGFAHDDEHALEEIRDRLPAGPTANFRSVTFTSDARWPNGKRNPA